jgi:hypothetical protein
VSYPPLLAYIHRLPVRVGSAYKYFKLLQAEYGGLLVSGLRGIPRPDLVVVRGDTHKDYLMAVQANVPYILIEHDMCSYRTGKPNDFEQPRAEGASGIIFTTEELQAHYAAKGWNLPPMVTIHLRPLKEDLIFEPERKLRGKHLVYCGGIVGRSRRATRFGYRDYTDIFAAFMLAGWTVHVYPANSVSEATLAEYRALGCVMHEPMPYRELLAECSRYTAGLQAYNPDGVPLSGHQYIQVCRPNKTWDYLASGIPTIGYSGGNTMSIYNGKWGTVVDSLDHDVLANIKLPHITQKMRFAETMDQDARLMRHIVSWALYANLPCSECGKRTLV